MSFMCEYDRRTTEAEWHTDTDNAVLEHPSSNQRVTDFRSFDPPWCHSVLQQDTENLIDPQALNTGRGQSSLCIVHSDSMCCKCEQTKVDKLLIQICEDLTAPHVL